MLILTRRSGESLYIDISESVDPATPVGQLFADGPIEIEILQVGEQAKLGIDAAPVLARVLEVGNLVDAESRPVRDGLARLVGSSAGKRTALGAVALLIIAGLGWWAGTGQSSLGHLPGSERQVASRETPLALPRASTALAEDRAAESAVAAASTHEVSRHEPSPIDGSAAPEVTAQQAMPNKPPRQPVMPGPLAQRQLISSAESMLRSDAPPAPEPVTHQRIEAGQLLHPGRADTDKGRSERDQVAFSAVTMSAKQEPAPARLASASVAEPPESPRAIAVTADGGVHREAWLLKQAPHRYTLQLFGVSRESAVLRFLRTQQLDGPVAYYRTRFKGDDWFVLLHGDYPDANCAREAYAGLPKAARTGRPYPRSMAAVQAGIVAAAESR